MNASSGSKEGTQRAGRGRCGEWGGAWTRRGALGVVRAAGLWVHSEVSGARQHARMEETWNMRDRRTDCVVLLTGLRGSQGHRGTK